MARLHGIGLLSARLTAVVSCALALTIQAETALAEQRSVVTLHGVRRDDALPVDVDETIQRVVRQGLPETTLDYYSEHLDLARFNDPVYLDAFRTFLKHKYAGRRFDVVIPTTDSTLAFVKAYRDELFPGASVVSTASRYNDLGPRSTGATATLDMSRTIALVGRLQPETKRVVVVSGSSPFDKFYEGLARAQLQKFEGRFEIVYWSGLPMEELLKRVANLPSQSIVYPMTITEDSTGQRFTVLEGFDRVAAAANAPVYTWITTLMNRGVVGGSMFSTELVATRVAELAVRVLRGEKPEAVPVVEIDGNVAEVDWRQLRRWGISEARVPAGTTVRFREPGLWARYRYFIIGTVILVLVQTALIGGLLFQLARRRRFEIALRESEERFRVMADTAPVMIWRSGTDKGCDFFNNPWLEFRGRTADEEMGSGWSEGVHPADLEGCLATYIAAFDERRPFRMEYRLLRADGEYRWVLDSGVPRFAAGGTFAGFIGSCLDITERKSTEAELRDSEMALRQSVQENRDLAGRLITAQEVESARIARELHDGVSQELAGVSIMLGILMQRLGASSADGDIKATLGVVQGRTASVADDIRNLSHELHSGVLEHAGLTAALQQHCADVARHHHFDVTLTAGESLGTLQADIALCLYRVTQEALTNTARHAGARAAHVRLARTPEDIELDVVDDGVGFDPNRPNGSGLGLRSIGERVRFAKGSVRIESQPGHGTKLLVRIPVPDITTSSPLVTG